MKKERKERYLSCFVVVELDEGGKGLVESFRGSLGARFGLQRKRKFNFIHIHYHSTHSHSTLLFEWS